MIERVADIDWGSLTAGPFHPSPASWADQVLYFLLVDRFSDGRENGYRDVDGVPVVGTTALFAQGDEESAVRTDADAAAWRDAGGTWVGGTLEGVRSKLGYLRRLGVTALWISPVLRQRAGSHDYHGYAIQNFLEVDRHFGTADDLRRLVREAHEAGLRVILDIVLNHTGDVFAYDADRYVSVDASGQRVVDPRWDGRPYRVAGWRDAAGRPAFPFPQPVDVGQPDAAVWPAELQQDGTFTCRGRISNWDYDPEYREGDFFGLKDVHHGVGDVDDYQPSGALQTLTRAYQYWIAFADLDGCRVDAVKHMDPGATRFLTSAVHEFAQSIGKDRFFLVGEITGPREFAVDLMETTGLDAALGLGEVQGNLEALVRGQREARAYFDLFRNSELIGQSSHTWFRDHVVTSYDDHDQVRQGEQKSRFAAGPDGAVLASAVLAVNALTLGIPCVYYGSEQAFDGHGGNDRYIREAMFGGAFGPFRSRDRHRFDETNPVFTESAALLAIRAEEITLRRGRQYLRQISGDGVGFGFPRSFGGRITSIIAWSRILATREIVCAVNTDPVSWQTAWVTIDAGLHEVGDRFVYRHRSDGAAGTIAHVAALNGLAVQVSVPPAGVALLIPGP
jgi:glycosidase